MHHCALLQTGEIQAIVGDATRDGVGGPQYCGLWSLTSKHRPFNAFGNSYAGLIPSDIRGKSPTLEITGEHRCVLAHRPDDAYPVEARAEYQVRSPYYVDHTLTFTDRKDIRRMAWLAGCSYREVAWCSYLNCPEDLHLHFISGGKWVVYMSPEHGTGSNIAPAYVPERELEVWPARIQTKDVPFLQPFYRDRIKERFDEPFYYGRLGSMALILVFDDPRRLRFFCSPSGGGISLLPGMTCPAWDFMWVIPESEYRVGKKYRFRLRLIYKPFVSEDDVLDECRNAQAELGFETVPKK
jgi:hypothetical protein